MRTKIAKRVALKISEGILKTTTDVVLFMFFLTCASAGKPKTSLGTHQAFRDANAALRELNYDIIKRTLAQLKRRGYVTYQRKHLKETIEITKEGKERLEQLLPTYRARRTWDHRMYLVTYDIPEVRKYNRDILRDYLRRIGAGMLQKSVWITPYNPRETLRSFLTEHGLSEIVIVSDLGTDAIIGEIDLKTLIHNIYRLDQLNKRYELFLEVYEGSKNPNCSCASVYLSILHDDPQLPFSLLPKDWLGDDAYKLALQICPALHL